MKQLIIDLAERLAATPYRAPAASAAASAIGYTDYLGIRVRPGREIWAEQGLDFELHPLPLGSLFVTPIELNLVNGSKISAVTTAGDFYEHSLPAALSPRDGNLGISGFRLTAELNAPGVMDEFAVFQGASYFRMLSKGQVYGLSARGLSIGVGQAEPEEFPAFARFWVERPRTPGLVILHALLDSVSIAGAYTFRIRPGASTTADVDMTLFPRKSLERVGIAPLSSMFFYGVGDGVRHPRDYRPEVHDSDGLLIETGRGERLWRPLRNSSALRASSFFDTALKGFGLMQRERSFGLYQDLEANYHRRPSAWIAPASDWGAGAVELFEIPTDSEYHDNIVAQWRPAAALQPGRHYRYLYRVSWPNDVEAGHGSTVNWTRTGPPLNTAAEPGAERFVIDYRSARLDAGTLPRATVTASSGVVSAVAVQPNTATGGLRVSFLYQPAAPDIAELRIDLQGPGSEGAEAWLYQWSRDKASRSP